MRGRGCTLLMIFMHVNVHKVYIPNSDDYRGHSVDCEYGMRVYCLRGPDNFSLNGKHSYTYRGDLVTPGH